MKLDKAELRTVKSMQDDYGLRVTSIGSPIGKVKLIDFDDGTHNRFVPFARYLKEDVAGARRKAEAPEGRMNPGLSLYHPPRDGSPPPLDPGPRPSAPHPS